MTNGLAEFWMRSIELPAEPIKAIGKTDSSQPWRLGRRRLCAPTSITTRASSLSSRASAVKCSARQVRDSPRAARLARHLVLIASH